MGHTIWIESQGRPGDETHRDLSILLNLKEPLDALAEELGVIKPSAFYDYLPLLEEYQSLGEEAGITEELPAPSWFDASKGLESIRAIRAKLEADFDSLAWKPDNSTLHWPQTLVDELCFSEAVLEQAAARGNMFRLMIVP